MLCDSLSSSSGSRGTHNSVWLLKCCRCSQVESSPNNVAFLVCPLLARHFPSMQENLLPFNFTNEADCKSFETTENLWWVSCLSNFTIGIFKDCKEDINLLSNVETGSTDVPWQLSENKKLYRALIVSAKNRTWQQLLWWVSVLLFIRKPAVNILQVQKYTEFSDLLTWTKLFFWNLPDSKQISFITTTSSAGEWIRHLRTPSWPTRVLQKREKGELSWSWLLKVGVGIIIGSSSMSLVSSFWRFVRDAEESVDLLAVESDLLWFGAENNELHNKDELPVRLE